jgi:hypothetical protein
MRIFKVLGNLNTSMGVDIKFSNSIYQSLHKKRTLHLPEIAGRFKPSSAVVRMIIC